MWNYVAELLQELKEIKPEEYKKARKCMYVVEETTSTNWNDSSFQSFNTETRALEIADFIRKCREKDVTNYGYDSFSTNAIFVYKVNYDECECKDVTYYIFNERTSKFNKYNGNYEEEVPERNGIEFVDIFDEY